MTDRTALRAILRNRRQEFLAGGTPAFAVHAALIDILQNAAIAGGYCAMRFEPDVTTLLGIARESALPSFEDKQSPMNFRSWRPGDGLSKSPFGFGQPDTVAEVVVPDVLLIPLLGFDRSGNRIGQGAGHYDKYLSNNSNLLKIGVSWSCQEVARVRCEPWDIPLDAIATETEWIVTSVRGEATA